MIISLLFLCSCSYTRKVEDYNYLEDNSLRFIRTDDETSILINKDNIYYLLILGEENIDIEVDYLIKYKNISTNISAKEEFLLSNDLTINDLTFKINDKIVIMINNNKFCIYVRELDKDNYSECDFLYLYNPGDDFYITLNSDLQVLFYHAYTKFTYKFMHHLATVWIDSYTISPFGYTTVTIDAYNFEVTSIKRRGKTIHKKEIS